MTKDEIYKKIIDTRNYIISCRESDSFMINDSQSEDEAAKICYFVLEYFPFYPSINRKFNKDEWESFKENVKALLKYYATKNNKYEYDRYRELYNNGKITKDELESEFLLQIEVDEAEEKRSLEKFNKWIDSIEITK